MTETTGMPSSNEENRPVSGASSTKPAAERAQPSGVPKQSGSSASAASQAGSAGATAPKPSVAKAAAPKKEEESAPSAPKGVTRREFLNYVWGASMALFLLQFGGITFLFAMPRFREGQFGGKITVAASDFPEPNATPRVNNVGKFWLVHVNEGIGAIYTICTHLGCIYAWNEASRIFACPCHGSQFQLNGKWIAGPAPRDLDRFAFEVLDASGNVIAESPRGEFIKLPEGAASVRVNTGAKVLGQSNL